VLVPFVEPYETDKCILWANAELFEIKERGVFSYHWAFKGYCYHCYYYEMSVQGEPSTTAFW
jgi:hypothetical protein